MGESFAKKERNKLKAKKKEEKALKAKQRATKGTDSFEDMIAYVDEFGNLSDTPVTIAKSEIKLEDIQLGAAPAEPINKERWGTVAVFDTTKGFGFIMDDTTNSKIFVHTTGLTEAITEGDRVSFERAHNDRGYCAVQVKKLK